MVHMCSGTVQVHNVLVCTESVHCTCIRMYIAIFSFAGGIYSGGGMLTVLQYVHVQCSTYVSPSRFSRLGTQVS